MAEGDCQLLSVEPANIVTEWLATTLLDAIKISRKLFELLTARKLLNEGVHELSKGGDGVVRQVGEPLQGRSYQAGPETLAHARLSEIAGYRGSEHPLLVRHYVIRGINGAVVELHVQKGELLRHLHKCESIDEWKISVAVWLALMKRSWDPWDPLNHCLYFF